MICELCGKEAELVKAIVEETELNVCRSCAKFGKVIKKPVFVEKPRPAKIPETEITEVIVPDYAERIRAAREKRNLKQKDFAKLISEKESLVHNLEIGRQKLSIDLARKLEKILKVKLVEQYEEAEESKTRGNSEGFTIGDFVRFKK